MVDSPFAMETSRPPGEDAPLSDLDRALIGGAVRLEVELKDRYHVRRVLEIWAGAIQRAIATTHKADLPERSVLMEVNYHLAMARLATSRKKGKPLRTALSPERAADTIHQFPQARQSTVKPYHR